MLEYAALFILIFVVLVLFYGIIVIHDIPYEIAVKRNHPHQDVLHVAGWVSLFTLHAIWPFLWIWAMLREQPKTPPNVPNCRRRTALNFSTMRMSLLKQIQNSTNSRQK